MIGIKRPSDSIIEFEDFKSNFGEPVNQFVKIGAGHELRLALVARLLGESACRTIDDSDESTGDRLHVQVNVLRAPAAEDVAQSAREPYRVAAALRRHSTGARLRDVRRHRLELRRAVASLEYRRGLRAERRLSGGVQRASTNILSCALIRSLIINERGRKERYFRYCERNERLFAQLFFEELADVFGPLSVRHVLLRARDEERNATPTELGGHRAEQVVEAAKKDDTN